MTNKRRLIGAAMLAATFAAGTVSAQTTYTWTGAADGNWSNAANWAASGIPVDDTPGTGILNGISARTDDIIEFSGTTMPTTNFPGIGGYYTPDVASNSTPQVVFNSGGEFTMNLVGYESEVMSNDHLDRNAFTFGDGVTGATENVTINWTGGPELSRHGNNIHYYTVNADATVTKNNGCDFSRGTGRTGIMTINGGTFITTGATWDLKAQTTPVINFSALGSSYQSAWGGEFNNIPDVEDSFGVDLLNTSGVAGSELVAFSVGGGWKVELLSSNDVANLYTTYTWTGSAGDQDWDNAANWDANGIPVDDTADTTNKYFGLTMPYKDKIVFAGTAMPTSNVPEIGGWYDNTSVQGDSPTMVFNSGGEISLDVTGEFFSFLTNPGNDLRSVLTVGDGIEGVDEDVIVNISVGETNAINGVLNRHNNGAHDFLVKSDGTLNIEHAKTNYVDVSYNTSLRIVTFTIEGGEVVINDAVSDLSGNCYVGFTAPGGTFTANYGAQFPDITAVWASLGTSFVDNTGNLLGTLQAVDVDGTKFTVSVVPTAVQWASAQGINSDADVSVEGDLEYAYNAGGSATTVNGVLFAGAGSSTNAFGGDITLTEFTGVTSGYGSTEDPFNLLPSQYRALLDTAVTNGMAASAVTLNNLTVGKRYQVQVWVNDSSLSNTNAQDVFLSIGTASAVTLDPADPDVEGALGQYAIGTFVADATSQTFALGSNRLQLNAIQVREVLDINVGFWTGTGGATWDAAITPNFAINKLDEALNVAVFDVAKAVNGTVTFADAYFDSDTPNLITENNISISGSVEADEIKFVNDSVEYTVNGASGTIGGASEVAMSGGGKVNLTGDDMLLNSGNLIIENGTLLESSRNSLRSLAGNIVLDNGEIREMSNHLQLNGLEIILGSGGGTLTHVNNRNIYGIGVISGSGQLTIDNEDQSDAGRVQLASANTYTGGTIIQNGGQGWAYTDASFGAAGTQVTSINNGDVQLVNNVNFGIRNFVIESGTMDIKGGKLGQFGGTISGAGALNLTGGGSAYIKGTNTYTGGTTIQRYTRATLSEAFGTGDVTIDNGAQLHNNNSAPVYANNFIIGDGGAELKSGWGQDTVINGSLSGAGNLTIVNDSGSIFLMGDGSGYTGTNTVSNSATLGGNIGAGELIVLTNSTLIVGTTNTLGTVAVSGDVTFDSTASLFMEAAGTSSDSITVGGTLDITGVTLTLDITSPLSGAGAVLATAGTITGEFSGYPEGTEVQSGFIISYLDGAVTLAPTGPYEVPTIESAMSNGNMVITWPSSIHAGDQFNVMTNTDLKNGTWTVNPSIVPFEDGDVYKAIDPAGSAGEVFYMLEY